MPNYLRWDMGLLLPLHLKWKMGSPWISSLPALGQDSHHGGHRPHTQTGVQHQLSWVSSLPTTDPGTSQLPQFPQPIPYFMDRDRDISILLVLFLWRILTNTAAKCRPAKALTNSAAFHALFRH